MNKFSVDYDKLQNTLSQKKSYRLADVQHRLRKVAFDVVKFKDGENIDQLWQIQSCDDGDYIVALYDEDTSNKKVATASISWSVIADSSGDSVNIFYKDSIVGKISLSSVGIPVCESEDVCASLPVKLASNKSLANSLLNEMSEGSKRELFAKYPELK